MINWLKGSRLLSKTPKFFAWVRNASGSLSITCIGLLQTPQYLPDGFDEYLKLGIVAGAVGALVAQLGSSKHDAPTSNPS